MAVTPNVEDSQQEPEALLAIPPQDDETKREQVRRLALEYDRGLRGSGLVAKDIIDIVGQDGTHCALPSHADPQLKVVRHMLQEFLTPVDAMHNIGVLLDVRGLRAEERTAERIAYLEGLQDGWMNGEGRAPTAEALAALKAVLKTVSSMQYGIFPMVCGGIQMETVEPLAAVEFRIQASGEIIAEIV